VQQRFCQQCGRFQPLSQFDGDKRSCRMGLQRRRATDKRRQAAAAAASTSMAHICMPAGTHQACFCAGCSTAAGEGFQMAAAFQQQAAMFGCSGFPAPAAAAYDPVAAAAPAAKRMKPSNSSNTQNNIIGMGCLPRTTANQALMWAPQQQQQQSGAAADSDLTAMLQAFQNDHMKDWTAAEIEADSALEQQLQQQQSAVSAPTASTAFTNNVSNNIDMRSGHLAPLGKPIWRMDSNTGSSGSSSSMAFSPLPIPAAAAAAGGGAAAASAADVDNVLDGLLDVLCVELQARAEAGPMATAAVSPTTSAGSFAATQQNNNSPAMTTAGAHLPSQLQAKPAAAAAAAAGQTHIRASLAAIKAELQQVTASLVGHSAAAAAAAGPAASGVSQLMPALQLQPAAAAAGGAGAAVAQRIEVLQQKMAQLSGHLAQLQAVQQVQRWAMV
jgi:hypothetical protein